jgi:hypothetical protein
MVGLFTPVCVAAWLALIPAAAWDHGIRRLTQAPRPFPMRRLRAIVRRRMRTVLRYAAPATKGWLGTDRWSQVLAAVVLAYVVLWNLRGANALRFGRALPHQLDVVAMALRLDQHWDMFAPHPSLQDGWHVADGTLRDGDHVNLIAPAYPPSDKPAQVTDVYRDERWRKYLDNLRSDQYRHLAPYCASYLIRDWNSRHSGEQRLRRLSLRFLEQDVLPDFRRRTVTPILLWEGVDTSAK